MFFLIRSPTHGEMENSQNQRESFDILFYSLLVHVLTAQNWGYGEHQRGELLLIFFFFFGGGGGGGRGKTGGLSFAIFFFFGGG